MINWAASLSGSRRPVGDYLRQVVELEGEPVALLVWGPACYALKDRDLWIGWSATQRVERLKLIVQNRRFLLLRAKGQSPNLLRKCWRRPCARCPRSGRNVSATVPCWRKVSPIRRLTRALVTRPATGAGGWSAGYSRHRADFYVANERPKKLWLRPLADQGRQQLRAVELPADCRGGVIAAPSGQLPLSPPQVDSLEEVLRRAPDPRDSNTQYRTGPVLTIIALALLAGGGRSPRSPVLPRP